MKIVLLYLRIINKWDVNHPEHKSYEESSARFLATYKQFKPKIKHDLIVVNCGSSEHDGMLDSIANGYENYNGGGYDCGTYQAVGSSLNADLVFGLNTHAYFWRDGWLEPFAIMASICGPGVYGATASYEINPHLRTPAIAFNPRVMRGYPKQINSRNDAAEFEAGPNNFSLWAITNGYPVWLVTAENTHQLDHWRHPRNIFRRGDQRNCLVWDRHTDIYALADAATKVSLENAADGK